MKKLKKDEVTTRVNLCNNVVDRAIVSEVQTNALTLACDLLIIDDRVPFQLPQGSSIQFKYGVCVVYNTFNLATVCQRVSTLGGHSNTIVPCTTAGNSRPAYSSTMAPKTNSLNLVLFSTESGAHTPWITNLGSEG